ncbi:MAG: hypothetical protein JWQ40_4817, partial [Segetibacter sp.]|nr:hypothetical protein [Segetibacter sp.]
MPFAIVNHTVALKLLIINLNLTIKIIAPQFAPLTDNGYLWREIIVVMGTIRFALRTDKALKNGTSPIDLIYQVSGQRKFFRTDLKLYP